MKEFESPVENIPRRAPRPLRKNHIRAIPVQRRVLEPYRIKPPHPNVPESPLKRAS